MRLLAILAALLLPAFAAQAQPPQFRPHAGDSYELRRDRETAQHGSDGSSSSSTDRDTLVARVIDVREDGVELVYDLPATATADERAIDWQFPARVFKPFHGPMQLLNRAELQTRLDRWLAAANFPRGACGRWYFTWNAFQIECDPETVLQAIASFDPQPDELREGAPIGDPMARGTAPLRRTRADANGATFTAELQVDPDAIRRAGAQADVVVAELMRRPTNLEAALQAHTADSISGTIAITWDSDSTGLVQRRVTLARTETRTPDGVVETETVTETLERRAIASGNRPGS